MFKHEKYMFKYEEEMINYIYSNLPEKRRNEFL